MVSDYSDVKEFEALEEVIQSTDWRAYVKLLEKRRAYLQEQVNICLRKHEDRRAGEWLAKMDDCDKIIDVIGGRIKQLREQQEKQ